MAVNQKRRQKRLMKKRRRDKEKGRKDSSSSSYTFLSPKKKILKSRDLPIHECLINAPWRENGLATILLSRRQPDGYVLYGIYLVDILCLGLKNAVCDADVSVRVYEADVRPAVSSNERLVECPVSLAHQIIYGAIDFAAQFGFEPHKDFGLSRHILEERAKTEECEDVEFGKDGRPLYIQGPHDDARSILRRLDSNPGEGGYDFIIGGPAPTFAPGQ